MREFQRRVRLALEEHHMLPGDPMRVFNTFTGKDESSQAASFPHPEEVQPPPAPHDPTTIKPHESNPFSGE
jgi:small conductance mechanosensitive channel